MGKGRSCEDAQARCRSVGSKDCYYLELDPQMLTVLPQMRKTFDLEPIEDLAESIKSQGQINEILVNKREEKGEVIYELIAGERRYRAFRLLREQGYGIKIKCKVFQNLTRIEFLSLQVAENLHEKVPANQEAEAIYGMWKFAKNTEELAKITLTEYENTERIKKFAEDLHPEIAKLVYDKVLGYSAAIAISRLNGYEKQLFMAQKAVLFNLTGKDVEKRVGAYVRECDLGQTSILELTLDTFDFNEHELSVGVEQVLGRQARGYVEYLKKMLYLLKKGYVSNRVFTPAAQCMIIENASLKTAFDPYFKSIYSTVNEQ